MDPDANIDVAASCALQLQGMQCKLVDKVCGAV